MDDLKDLIHALKNSIPELDPDPLYASVPPPLSLKLFWIGYMTTSAHNI